jgi:DNA-binding MarR family transcriptional regulator
MSMMRNICLSARAYTLYRDEKLKALGLSAAKASYLVTIRNHPGITQEELALNLVYNASSVARQVARLEKDGFIRRERSLEDRRQFLLYATQKGLDVLPQVSQINTSFITKMTAAFSPEELETLLNLTNRLCHCAKESCQEL